MFNRTLEAPETIAPNIINQTVNERGFFLYEWISPEELRMTLDRDYLIIVRWASIPLAVITGIAGLIGFSGGPIGTIFAVLIVLSIFYSIVAIVLSIKFLYYSYLYTRGASVVITDHHYISGGSIVESVDQESIKNNFSKYEKAFDEPFMGESRLEEKKKIAKTALFDNLKSIASGGGKLLQNIGRSRDSGGLVIVVMIAGFLYATMMGIIYFIGIFFISLFGRVFAWMAHRVLLASNDLEHKIQTLFSHIDTNSRSLQESKDKTIALLYEAGQNEWKENLLGKINTSTTLLSELAGAATDDVTSLHRLLMSSRYKDIFNFVKYRNWAKKQILEPIESILELLEKNTKIIIETTIGLETQIINTSDPTLKHPLILQKERLEIQLETFRRVIQIFHEYRMKLIS